ncbi:hypothetical protein AAFF_G00311290 [Aldrovandia affinis]|uniref:Uncharacterized protein n=1 Tax=Aldrovandia affinis TaxID=143900 RepID=A0AAD7R7J7_9TELE|nr:hypothetical protein AAFF_G00311290 [Aldrovandia affinis]
MQTVGLIHTLEQCLNRTQTVGLIHTLEQCFNRMQTVGLIHTLEQCLNRMQTMGLIHTLEQCLNRMQTVGLIHTLEQRLNRMQTVGLIHTQNKTWYDIIGRCAVKTWPRSRRTRIEPAPALAHERNRFPAGIIPYCTGADCRSSVRPERDASRTDTGQQLHRSSALAGAAV